jgi:excisionase family DNA binding protein
MERLTQEQAAEFLGISKEQLTSLCRRRALAYYSPSRGVRLFLQSDLDSYLESKRVEAWSIKDEVGRVGGLNTVTGKTASTRNMAGKPGEPQSWKNVN